MKCRNFLAALLALPALAPVAASLLAMPSETAPATRWCDLLPRPGNKHLPRVDLPDDWFVVYRLGDGVFAIGEPFQFQEVISYLVLGSKSALLFDTGLGIGNIKRIVNTLTRLPVTVLNSHTHFDHVGGNADFDRILAMDTDYTRANAHGFSHEAIQGEVEPAALCHGLPAGFDSARYRTRPFAVCSGMVEFQILTSRAALAGRRGDSTRGGSGLDVPVVPK